MSELAKKKMITERIRIKFEDQLYQAEVPVSDTFTGSVAMTFHWFQGKLMKSEVSKSSMTKIDLSTAQTGLQEKHDGA